MQHYTVPDMTCGHCVRAIEKAVKGVDAQATVQADVAAKRVSVDTAESGERIVQALRDAGYDSTALAF